MSDEQSWYWGGLAAGAAAGLALAYVLPRAWAGPVGLALFFAGGAIGKALYKKRTRP